MYLSPVEAIARSVWLGAGLRSAFIPIFYKKKVDIKIWSDVLFFTQPEV